MKISGLTFVRNATKLYFPIKESIESILPLCDEFVVALGPSDGDDQTEAEIRKIDSNKIRIIHTQWDSEKYPQNTLYAEQTDRALKECSGDWLFYIQSDEVVHEDDLLKIKKQCSHYLNDSRVEGFLFKYRHFWGDYQHYQVCHNWYPREIRIVRNLPEVHSWRDAQSFRLYDKFRSGDYREYLRKEGTRKLNVVELDAYINHYGCVRPPELMVKKIKKMDDSYQGKVVDGSDIQEQYYDYGPLDQLPVFEGTHPKVMDGWIKKFSWQDKLQYRGPRKKDRPAHTHEKLKVKLHTFIEQKFFGGRIIGGFKNYNIVK